MKHVEGYANNKSRLLPKQSTAITKKERKKKKWARLNLDRRVNYCQGPASEQTMQESKNETLESV